MPWDPPMHVGTQTLTSMSVSTSSCSFYFVLANPVTSFSGSPPAAPPPPAAAAAALREAAEAGLWRLCALRSSAGAMRPPAPTHDRSAAAMTCRCEDENKPAARNLNHQTGST